MTEADKYEVLEKIGHGSFGIIRKVKRKSDGHVLCRKEISYLRMSTKEREQLQAELNILKELRHPNIVAYYEREHLKASQDLHLYMEYCGNGDLGRMIKDLKHKNEYASEDFVWTTLAQLVTALYRCHYGENPPDVGQDPRPQKRTQFMILHRDLKPENVFLGEENSVKLGDFGLSKILASHDFASTYVGTPFYMSPEICAAERYTLHSDIWALGCIIYELCAREPPFNAKTHLELIQKIKLAKISRIPAHYSRELHEVIASCLKANPNLRPDTAQLLSLPMVQQKRREQDLKMQKVLAVREVAQAQAQIARLKAEKEAMRAEIDATVRREWEVKARLEIDRLVQVEISRLQATFEAEVAKRVTEELKKHQASAASSQELVIEPAVPVRSSTPTFDVDEPVQQASLSASEESDEFASQTDATSISLDSPIQQRMAKPLKRTARTPFGRAQTMFAGAAVASPMDVQMADPSPMSIASLSLSPRRTGVQADRQPVPRRNIFAAAEDKTGGTWEGLNVEFSDEEDEAVPNLPSPSRNNNRMPDPFKVLPRPSLGGRQRTLPAKNNLGSAPNLFAAAAAQPAVRARPQSTVPVIATSPSRRQSKLPALNNENGSPQRRAPPPPTTGAGLKSKYKNDDMIKQAMRNNLQGRTLVELAQARGVPPEVKERTDSEENIKKNITVAATGEGVRYAAKLADREREAVTWDPERDEMPSPFLVRGKFRPMV